MGFMSHNWSATKQRLHPQSVAEISRHSVLSGDRIQQCETSSGSRHKDTDRCLFALKFADTGSRHKDTDQCLFALKFADIGSRHKDTDQCLFALKFADTGSRHKDTDRCLFALMFADSHVCLFASLQLCLFCRLTNRKTLSFGHVDIQMYNRMKVVERK